MLSNEKNLGNLVCSIEILLLFKFIWLEAFYNEEFSILYTIQSTGVVFMSVLECQLRKSFAHYKMSDNARNVKSVAEILWCTSRPNISAGAFMDEIRQERPNENPTLKNHKMHYRQLLNKKCGRNIAKSLAFKTWNKQCIFRQNKVISGKPWCGVTNC